MFSGSRSGARRVFSNRTALPFRASVRFQSNAAGTSEDGWELVVGLEIHAQSKTGRKLFSVAQTSYEDPPNTHVESLDSAFPGTSPVIDPEAVKSSIMTALALKCDINPRSTFDRKHYFYHDIPPSYQITQHYNPLARKGSVDFAPGDQGVEREFSVGIHQSQIEQDTAKSMTVAGETSVDSNRAGTGLMEIVTEPHMRSAEEAGAFVRKSQGISRRIGSGDGDMEKGNLRVDANVSVRRPGEPFNTRCEIKNVNSVRFLQQAIEAERRRHIAHYESQPGVPSKQETRGLNELTGETFSLRSKEEAEDYRYMPDHNSPASAIRPAYLEKLREKVPEMPWETDTRSQKDYGSNRRDVDTSLSSDEYGGAGIAYFEAVVPEPTLGKKACNWVTHESLGQSTKSGREWTPDVVPAPLLKELVLAVEGGKSTGSTARSVSKHVVENGSGAGKLEPSLEELGIQPSSADDSKALCEAVIAKSPKEAEKVRGGNDKVVMRLVGQVMKDSRGAADAQAARTLLLELIRR